MEEICINWFMIVLPTIHNNQLIACIVILVMVCYSMLPWLRAPATLSVLRRICHSTCCRSTAPLRPQHSAAAAAAERSAASSRRAGVKPLPQLAASSPTRIGSVSSATGSLTNGAAVLPLLLHCRIPRLAASSIAAHTVSRLSKCVFVSVAAQG